TFGAVELPRILNNPNVTTIEGIPREVLVSRQQTHGPQAPFEMVVARAREHVGELRVPARQPVNYAGQLMRDGIGNYEIDSREYFKGTSIEGKTPSFSGKSQSLTGHLNPPNRYALAGQQHFADLHAEQPHASVGRSPASVRNLIAPELLGSNLPPGARVMGAVGVAAMAYDFGTSGHKWVQLRSQGNTAGADSTATHFVGRNVGGAVGGFLAGAGVGLVTGSWTGPGVIISSLGGGALGAYLGDRWAEQKDIERIYTQTDALGRTWTRDPDDPQGRWLRNAQQQRVQTSDLSGEIEVSPVRAGIAGQEVLHHQPYVAAGRLERQLNYQAANASYALGLANPPPPQNPFRLDASGETLPPRTPFEAERAYVRNAQTGQWQREIKEVVDGRASITRIDPDPVSPERTSQLEQQSRIIIAQNAANSPAAMASRYMVAYEQYRYSDFGPPSPAIQAAQVRTNTLQASDGNTYQRQADGQWGGKGWIYDSMTNRNISAELDLTWQSQQAGLRDMATMAGIAKVNPQLKPEGIRGQVAALYARHGIDRSEAQLDAAAAAVEHNYDRDGGQRDFSLELMPDPRTRAPSADSAIALFADGGNNRMVLQSATTAEDIARIQATQQQQTSVTDSPERRIAAAASQQRDAQEQAMREANRAGLSREATAQVATLAAVQARAPRLDATQMGLAEEEVGLGRENAANSEVHAPAHCRRRVLPIRRCRWRWSARIRRASRQWMLPNPTMSQRHRCQSTPLHRWMSPDRVRWNPRHTFKWRTRRRAREPSRQPPRQENGCRPRLLPTRE
ncbi:MAG: hypothetical protein LBL59_09085, partial [Xanthomonadaceae bacterium]|nr:hypothetical protein [Xanthomonadaceae bacterium]